MTQCKFSMAWIGRCKNESEQDFCPEHREIKCAICGAQAHQDCDITVGPLVCGRPTCDRHRCNANHRW